jgi:hypothetical protein
MAIGLFTAAIKQSRQAGPWSVKASKLFWWAQLARFPQAGIRSNIALGAARSAMVNSLLERAAPRGTTLSTTTRAESSSEEAKAAWDVMAMGELMALF